MARFDLENYVTVEERIREFWAKHPNGRIHTEVVALDEEAASKRMVVIRAEVYTDAQNQMPTATGYAKEREGLAGANQTAFLENCETSAIGRALANLGMLTERGRPSREEMEAVERILATHDDTINQIKALGKVLTEDNPFRAELQDNWGEIKKDPLVAGRFLDRLHAVIEAEV